MSDTYGSLLYKRRDEVPKPAKPTSGSEYILKIMAVRDGEDNDKESGQPYDFLNFMIKAVDGPGEVGDMETIWQRFRCDKAKLVSMCWDMIDATGVDTDGLGLLDAAMATEGREFRATVKVTEEGWTNLSKFRSI